MKQLLLQLNQCFFCWHLSAVKSRARKQNPLGTWRCSTTCLDNTRNLKIMGHDASRWSKSEGVNPIELLCFFGKLNLEQWRTRISAMCNFIHLCTRLQQRSGRFDVAFPSAEAMACSIPAKNSPRGQNRCNSCTLELPLSHRNNCVAVATYL